MKVLEVYVNQYGMSTPPAALPLFKALLNRAGHTVDMWDMTGYKMPGFMDPMALREKNLFFPENQKLPGPSGDVFESFRRKLNTSSPDLLIFSVTENTFLPAIELLRRVPESRQVRNIFGGVFPTKAPRRALDFTEVDMVCKGEGENAIVELCDAIQYGKDYRSIQNLLIRTPDGIVKENPMGPAVDINQMPVPDYSLFESRRFLRALGKTNRLWRIVSIETHRGCPYPCRFCNSPGQSFLYKKETGTDFFRKKRPEKIREELIYARDVLKMESPFFWADTFLAWTEYELAAFCDMYSEFKLPFWCQTRPETVAPDRYGHKKLRMLKDVGLYWISFGLEHGDETYRKEMVGRPYKDSLVIDSMRVVAEMDIDHTLNNIIMFPSETREMAFQTIQLNRRVRPQELVLSSQSYQNRSFSIFTPFYGTPLREDTVRLGYIPADIICPSNSEDSILRMPAPYLSPEAGKGLARVAVMYVDFPRERWPEIREAEALTPAGDAKFEALSQEYRAIFHREAEPRIDQVNTVNQEATETIA